MASYNVSVRGLKWRILKQEFVNGKRKTIQVPKESYFSLGIGPDWSVEKIKAFISTLNKQNHLKKKETDAKIRAATQYKFLEEVDSAFLDPEQLKTFLTQLEENYFGNDKYFNKVLSRWKFCQKMIQELRIKPIEYYQKRKAFYKYFVQKECSLDHCNKVLRLLNEWGRFNSDHFIPVPTPKGLERSVIATAYKKSSNFRGESDPLTPELLDAKKNQLKPEHYNWLFVSIWLGLRPEEIDQKNFRTEVQKDTLCVLIYQSKLYELEEEKRWKIIPCLYPQQKLAVNLWSNIKRPHQKIMQINFPGIGLYGGRKGFELLMREKGHIIEHISSWLGHQSLEMTWKKYRNKLIAKF